MFSRILSAQVPKTSFFLFGPRQTGKSTLLRGLDVDLYVDLLDPEEHLAFVKRPRLLVERIDALAEARFVVVDEIQKAPALLDAIHLCMERDPSVVFAMSGSSARKLRRGAANLLGGRALYRTLHPLTHAEMADSFALEDCLAFGSLPRIWTLVTQGDRELARELLRSYVVTYLREEVASEALVRNLQGFQSFVDVAAAQFATQVNFSAVARDCQLPAATVREYYTILEDTLMGFFLRPFTRGVRKRMSAQPRFYFFDNGVTRAINGTLAAAPGPLERGRLYEQWFVQEVHRASEYHRRDWRLHFWRTSHGAEVDLLVEQGGRLVAAIECKHKRTVARSDLSGLRSFRESFPKVPCYVTTPDVHPRKIDFAEVLPPPLVIARLLDAV
jgi:predicted AAA+ superfamily ATPase